MKELIITYNEQPDEHGTYIVEQTQDLVRCRDCKWRDNADNSTKWLPCIDMKTSPNWFCADGEHKVNK